MNNNFNQSLDQTPFGLTQYQTMDLGANLGNLIDSNHCHVIYQHGNHHSQQSPQQQQHQAQQQQQSQQINSSAAALDMQMAIQQFAVGPFVQFAQSNASSNNNCLSGNASTSTSTNMNNVSCLQNEVITLKKINQNLQKELEKLTLNYRDSNLKIIEVEKMLQKFKEDNHLLLRDKMECEKELAEIKTKFDLDNEYYDPPPNLIIKEQSLYCNDCGFEVRSQAGLFIHRLNHFFMEKSMPRHLHLSTRSFTTMPDDSLHFKYKCHCCEIDNEREFSRHEIYMHIYQYHTFEIALKCKYCFLYFTSKSYLKDHLLEKHNLVVDGRKKKAKRKPTFTNDWNFDLNHHLETPTMEKRLNSALPMSDGYGAKKSKQNLQDHGAKTDSLNDLFAQMVGEKLDRTPTGDNTVSSQQQQQPPSESSSSLTTMIVKVTPASSSSSSSDSIKREEVNKIINDLEKTGGSMQCNYPGCKFVATTKTHLKFHVSAHLMSKYKCPYCTFVGNRIYDIKRHILKSTKHTNQHVYLCPRCDYATDSDKFFRTHFSKDHDYHADVNDVIEKMFGNESNQVGETMNSTFVHNPNIANRKVNLDPPQ